MHSAVSGPAALAAQINFASRCLAALFFGGAIPIVALVSAGLIVGSGDPGSPLQKGVLIVVAVVVVAVVVEAGRMGLRALERGWLPFLGFLAVVTAFTQVVRLFMTTL